jgi:hypothetical protein
VTSADCQACSSGCCSRGGFAILENVLETYRLYKAGALRRADYEFKAGLSLEDFIRRYFDVCVHEIEGRDDPLMCFHMRGLGPTSEPIAIPRVGRYWDTREEMFSRNPWLNRGCIFLSKSVPNWPEDDGEGDRYCILHSPLSGSQVTAKPIDCVFFTCNRPYEARVPSFDESERWFRVLGDAFPRSRPRFERMMGRKNGAVQQGDEADER